MERYIKIEEVTNKTNLRYDDLIEITNEYIKKENNEYEIHGNGDILYDEKSDVTNAPAWNVFIIPTLSKERWPDDCFILEISDISGTVTCLYNNHGRMVEKYI